MEPAAWGQQPFIPTANPSWLTVPQGLTNFSTNAGTGNYQAITERDGTGLGKDMVTFHAINAGNEYSNWSIAELRLMDYFLGRKPKQGSIGGFGATATGFGAASTPAFGQTGGFGQQSGFGPTTSTGFGQSSTNTGFGQSSTTNTGFGQHSAPAFGQQSASTGFGMQSSGFGQPATGFGQSSATPAFGAPSNAFGQTSTPAFGQPATTGGAFGRPATSTFGQPASTGFGQTATSSFGQQSTGFGAPVQSTGFGSAPSATGFGTTTGAFGNTSSGLGTTQNATSAFGAPRPTFGSTTTNLSSSFGATPAGQGFGTSSGTFGAATTTTAQPPTAFGASSSFGSTFGQPATSTFGTAQPAQTSGFGQSASTQPAAQFGQSTFGQPPATNSFGQPATTSTLPTFGGTFGQQPTQATNTGFSFGATTTPAGTTNALFQPGNTLARPAQQTPSAFTNPATGTGFGGQQQSQSMFPSGTFGQAGLSTFGKPNMFAAPSSTMGTSIFSQTNPWSGGQKLHATLDVNPYGINPLLQKSTTKSPPKQPAVVPKQTPRSSTAIRLKGIATPTAGPVLPESNRVSQQKRVPINIISGSPRDVVSLGLDVRFTPRRSVKKLLINHENGLLKPAIDKVEFEPNLEESAAAIIEDFRTEVKSTPKSHHSTPHSHASPQKALKYYTNPPIEDLLKLNDLELRTVENFQVSVPAYGSVRWLHPVDLLSVAKSKSGIESILGSIIIIEPQLVTVYPEDAGKAPEGMGLNLPAEINLIGVFPRNKKTGEIIDNDTDPLFHKHLKKLKTMPDTKFLGFEVVSGTWKFRVEHFSRYGLLESDSDSDINHADDDGTIPDEERSLSNSEIDVDDTFIGMTKTNRYGIVAMEEKSEEISESTESLNSDDSPSEVSSEAEIDASEAESDLENVDSEIHKKEELQLNNNTEFSIPAIEKIETARAVQNLKAHLFRSSPTPEKRALQCPTKGLMGFRSIFSKTPIVDASPPMKYMRTDLIKEFNTFVTSKAIRSTFTDVNIDVGVLLHSSTRIGFTHRQEIYFGSMIKVGRVNFENVSSIDTFKQCEIFLNHLITFTRVELENGCPRATLQSIKFEEISKVIDDHFPETELYTWRLLAALFDDFEVPKANAFTAEQLELIDQSIREEKISEWLKSKISNLISKEEKNCSGAQLVLNCLLSRDIAGALGACIQDRNYRLGTIVSQCGGHGTASSKVPYFEPKQNGLCGRGTMPQESLLALQSQIAQWNAMPQLKGTFSSDYYKVWCLLAGSIPAWGAEMFENYTWYMIFGMFYWYAGGGSLTLTEALNIFKENFQDGQIVAPTSGYGTSLNIDYLLLHLKTLGDLTIEDIVSSPTHCQSSLNSRMAWSLSIALDSKRLAFFGNTKNQELLCMDFVSELIRNSQWKLAVFVSSFLPDRFKREEVIKDILVRFYDYKDSSGSFFSPIGPSKDFMDLTEKYLVPKNWIHMSRVVFN